MPRGLKSKNTSSAQTALFTRAGGRQSRTTQQFRFDESLALFQYMPSLFGKESLDSLCEGVNCPHVSFCVSQFYKMINHLFKA